MKKLLLIFVGSILALSFLYGVIILDTGKSSIDKKEFAGIPPIKLPPVPPKDWYWLYMKAET